MGLFDFAMEYGKKSFNAGDDGADKINNTFRTKNSASRTSTCRLPTPRKKQCCWPVMCKV